MSFRTWSVTILKRSLFAFWVLLSIERVIISQELLTSTKRQLPTAIYFVDSSTSTPGKLGSETEPFKKLSEAVNHAVGEMSRRALDVRIVVRPGNDYREAIEIGRIPVKESSQTLTIEGDTNDGPPKLLGSDLWLGTSFGKAEPNEGYSVYFHPWAGALFGQQSDYWAGYGFHLPEVLRRRDSVRLGDFTLKHVLSYQSLKPGTFFVNSNVGQAGYGNYFVCPPLGTSMTEATQFEVAKRPFVLRIHECSHVVFKNLVLESAADYFDGGLQVSRCKNVMIEDCEFAFCSSYGANVSESRDISLKNCRFYKNGIKGLGGAYVKNLEVSQGSSSFNNWRGSNGEFDEWDAAGIKFFQIHDSTFHDIAVHDNLGRAMGLWLDTDVENVVVRNLDCQRNHFGVFYEASIGPCRIESCNLSNNSIGLYTSAADKLFVGDSTISNNHGEGQVVVFGHSFEGGRKFNNFETKQHHTSLGNDFEFFNNQIFWDRDDTLKILFSARGNDIEAYRRFQKTFRGSNNTYWHAKQSKVFMSGVDGQFIDFQSWKKELDYRP